MKFWIGARTRFRNKATLEQIGEERGFTATHSRPPEFLIAPTALHTHYWEAKPGYVGVLEVCVWRREATPLVARLAGRVRFMREADWTQVGESVSFTDSVALAELLAEERVAHTQVWDVNATVEGQLQVGIALVTDEVE